MQRATSEDFKDPIKIVLVYIGNGDTCRVAYSIDRNRIPDLETLLEVEKRDVHNYEAIRKIGKLVRAQYDHNINWIEDLDEAMPDVAENCKYILIGNFADVVFVTVQFQHTGSLTS
ncbi:hypothetical protein LPJ71_000231 [Coemansia sp. S17]|nr:hypothetical protein LPJ71_000231 [Coemansia sp. S17]